MSRRKFSEEEIRELEANPFTFKVSEAQISFTKEFKELFSKEYSEGLVPRMIFQKHGYDPKVLGRARITGFQQLIRKEIEAKLPFVDGTRAWGERKKMGGTSDEASVPANVEARLRYVEESLDFLKKILSVSIVKN